MRTRINTITLLQASVTLLVCLFLIGPVFLSILAGFTADYFKGVLTSGLTFRWINQVIASNIPQITRSISLATACTLIVLLAGVPLAYALAKTNKRWARLIEELLVLPIAVPGLAIALGLLLMYGGVPGLRTDAVFILVGHVVFTLPFMVRAVLAVIARIDLDVMEEAGRTLGANFWQRFFHIVIPNCREGILAGAITVFTLSLGEFNLTWLLHSPFTQTLPVGLADSYASLRVEIGSAYTAIFFVLIIPLTIALQHLTKLVK